jgi:hypothetical protein
MSTMVGIESIRCYPTTLALEMPDLCEARKFDERYVRSDLLVEARREPAVAGHGHDWLSARKAPGAGEAHQLVGSLLPCVLVDPETKCRIREEYVE